MKLLPFVAAAACLVAGAARAQSPGAAAGSAAAAATGTGLSGPATAGGGSMSGSGPQATIKGRGGHAGQRAWANTSHGNVARQPQGQATIHHGNGGTGSGNTSR